MTHVTAKACPHWASEHFPGLPTALGYNRHHLIAQITVHTPRYTSLRHAGMAAETHKKRSAMTGRPQKHRDTRRREQTHTRAVWLWELLSRTQRPPIQPGHLRLTASWVALDEPPSLHAPSQERSSEAHPDARGVPAV